MHANRQPRRSPADVDSSPVRAETARPPVEHCELCGLALAAEHAHLLEPASRQLLCSCEPCAILFSGRQGGRYRRVPREIELLPDFRLSDEQWEDLHLPDQPDLLRREHAGRAGPRPLPEPGRRHRVAPDARGLAGPAWTRTRCSCELEPDVEALLVNRVRPSAVYYRAPIDECYKLVGLIRAHWRGLSGGTEVWEEVARFFTSLKERSRPR